MNPICAKSLGEMKAFGSLTFWMKVLVIFLSCLYGDIRAGCILCHMKYHVHAIQYGRFRPLFLTCQQITGKFKNRITLSNYQRVMCIRQLIGKLPAS